MIKYMSLPLKTIWFNKKFILAVFILLHVFLFNVNVAEWGDSYRMLRASEFIKKGAYPGDEKRPPLFALILALRPANLDAVTWGRGVVFTISLGYLVIFSSLAEKYIKNKKYFSVANFLFIFNPVILYWSLRVMSDVLFGFLVLLSLYWLVLWDRKTDLGKLILLGFVSGLSILTRFEGYLLAVSMAIGIFLIGYRKGDNLLKLKYLYVLLKNNYWRVIVFVVTVILTIIPYWLVSNPFSSSYFGEASGRTYDYKTVWIFIASLFFIFGFTPALYIICRKLRVFVNFFTNHPAFLTFTLLELVLILLWPAAIPRIFLAIVPLLIIALVLAMEELFSLGKGKEIRWLLINLVILGFYILTQYYLKLQFLVPNKAIFVVILVLQVLIVVAMFYRRLVLFLIVLLLSIIIWSGNTVWIHRNIYSAIKQAALFVSSDINGVVASNDTTSVFDWYTNYVHYRTDLRTFYLGGNIKDGLKEHKNIDYLVITNEDGIVVKDKLNEASYLTLIRDFRYNISRKEFYARVYKVERPL